MNDIHAELNALRTRLDHLEQHNRRLRRAWMTLPAAVLLILLMGARWPAQKLQLEPVPEAPAASNAVSEPVIAPRFVVQDAHGKVRAVLDGRGLFLFGTDRQIRVWLTPEDLVYKGGNGRIRLALKASAEESSLVLRDAGGDEADLGNATVATPGSTYRRSVDSLVLIRNGKVIRTLP